MSGKFSIIAAVMLTAFAVCGYETEFGQGKWDRDQWQMVKSSRSGYIGEWQQYQDKLVNKVPDGTDPATYITSARNTFTAMLLKEEFSGDVTVELQCGFEFRMAPGIIISTLPLRPGTGSVAELPRHLEVILYDHGLNVWHHYFENNVQKWYKALSFLEKNAFAPGKTHALIFKIYTRKGLRFMEVACNGKSASALLPPDFPATYRIGIVASEGVNFFRAVKITRP